jgi:heme-degrading monooxygenase HmoA
MAVTVINKFVVSETAMPAFLEEFARHRSVLAAQPGFESGTLYRQQGGPGRFNIVNVAHWASAEALDAARKVLGAQYAAKRSDPGAEYERLGVEADHGLYGAIESY